MAQGIGNFIDRVQLGDDEAHQIAIGSSAYGICSSLSDTVEKIVSLPGFTLNPGTTIHIKFNNANLATNPTLNVNNTGAKPIFQYGNIPVGTDAETNGWQNGAILTLTYDGVGWVRDQGFNTNTQRGIQDNLNSDSANDSLSAKQGKVLKGLIDAMDASTPAASGDATAFIDSITQTDGKITSITKKNIPTASTSTAGIIKIGTTANDAAAGNHNHNSTYSHIHLTDYDFTDTQPLSKYVTFDKSKPVGAPKEEWYNGFISSHSNYHASYIINGHTNQNEWYVGHGIWREANTPHASAPTWYLLAHSGNVGTGDNNGQVKIAGQNVSVKGLKALAYKDSLSWADITNAPDEDLFVKKRTWTISSELDLVKQLPGMYDHTSNMNNTLPTGYGTVLNIHGNYKYGSLIAAETDNVMYYRTYYYDTDDSWQWRGEWQTIAHAAQSTNNIGSATQPIYMTNKGVIVAGTALKALAYKDSLTSSDIPDNAANTTGNAATATTATYIKCTDTRSTALDPTDLKAAQGVRFDFKAKGTINLTATDNYAGVMSFRPYASNSDWSGGNAHQLAFNSEGLHWRNGSASWGDWYQILDSDNTAAGANNAATLAWNTTYIIAKINNTDIKFTTMAKPSYAFTDLTEHPTTLSGYGITDAAANDHSHTLTIGNKSLSVSTSEQTWALHDILYNENIIEQSTSWDIITPGIYAVTNSSHDGSGHPGSTTGQTAPYAYGHLIVTRADGYGAAQFYISHIASGSKAANKGIRYRSGWNVNNPNKTEAERWQEWATILDDKNFNLYAPTLTGTGASGSWSISVTGTAANVTGTVAIEHGGTGATTASAAANALISGLPTWTTTPTADTYFIRRDTAGTATFGQVKFSTIANITNNTLTLGPYSSTLVTSVNGNIGNVTITAADLGLSNALHLIGVVTEDSSYQPSDGTYGVPAIVDMQETYTPASGDVIIDKNKLREYVFANNVWTLLGYTASQIYDSNTAVANEVNVPTWISKITQATDGSIRAERQTIGVLPINHGGTGTDTLPTNSLLFAKTTTNEGVSTQTLQSTHYIDTITEDNDTYSVLGVNTNSVDTGYRLKVNGDSKFLGKVDIVTQNGNNQVTTYGNQYTPIYWHEGIPTPTALVRKINFTIAASKYGVVIQDSLFDSNSIVTQIVVTSGIEYINSPLNWSYYNNNNVSGICIELENNSSLLAANTSISGYILVSQGETSGSMTTIDLPVNNNSEPEPEPQPDPEPEPDPETPPEDNNSNT